MNDYTQKSDVSSKIKQISDFITGSGGDWPDHSYSAFVGAYDFTIESGSDDVKVFEFNANPNVALPDTLGINIFNKAAQYAATQSYQSVHVYGSTWAGFTNPRVTAQPTISASFANLNISSSFVYNSAAIYNSCKVAASSSKFHFFIDMPSANIGVNDTLYTIASSSADKSQFRDVLEAANVGNTLIDNFVSSSKAANTGVGTWPDYVSKDAAEDASLLIAPTEMEFNSYLSNCEQRSEASGAYTDADGVEQHWSINSPWTESMQYFWDIDQHPYSTRYAEKFIVSSGSVDSAGNKYLGQGRAMVLFTPQYTEVLGSWYQPQWIQISEPTAVSSSAGDYYQWKLYANRGTTSASGSLIRMYDGSTKQVQDIVVGDVVKSYEPAGIPNRDVNFANYSSTDLAGSVASGSVVTETTSAVMPEHYVINGTYKFGWMGMIFVNRAGLGTYQFVRGYSIEVGDELMDKDGNWIEVTSVQEVSTDETFYSLDVEDIDTYFSSDILVHNLPPKPACLLPDQLINMSDGTKKRIDEIVLRDEVVVYDEKNDEFKDGRVNEIVIKLHDDCYELTLENGKVLKPTGNHPILLKGKGWGTIDAYKPNCAGGSYKVQVGDYVLMLKDRVLDTISDWVKITKIVEIPGEYETYNLGNQDYGTIIVDDIVTHNS